MLSTISFSKTALLIRKNVIEKVDIWVSIHFSKIFDNVDRILILPKFSFISFLPLLCKNVTSTYFEKKRKLADLIALFFLVYKNFANISILSLIIAVVRSVFCEALVSSNLRISFSNAPILTSSKWFILFLLYFWIARISKWIFHFKMTSETGSLVFSVKDSFESNFAISSLFTIFENKLFKFSAISDSDVNVFSFLVKFIFSLDTSLSESNGPNVFQNILLYLTFFSSNLW